MPACFSRTIPSQAKHSAATMPNSGVRANVHGATMQSAAAVKHTVVV